MRVYCGLASHGQRIAVAVLDDAGRLVVTDEIADSPEGYAKVRALISNHETGATTERAAIATDSETNLVSLLLAASGEPLAVGDAETLAPLEEGGAAHNQEPQHRAVVLARAVQAGTLVATAQPAPRDLAALRPVLTAHRAALAGRTAAVAMLRDVLREMYPAALRALRDPSNPTALAVLERLPDPTQVAQGRDDELIAALREAGCSDANAVLEQLRKAVGEMTGRRTTNPNAIAPVVRNSVAAVRAADGVVTSLMGVVAEHVEPRTSGHGFPSPMAGHAPTSGPPVAGRPVSGPPVSGPPVSGAPVSAAPASGVPVSAQPASAPPTSAPPAAQSPASSPLTSSPLTASPPGQPPAQPPRQPGPAESPVSAPVGFSGPHRITPEYPQSPSAPAHPQPPSAPQSAPPATPAASAGTAGGAPGAPQQPGFAHGGHQGPQQPVGGPYGALTPVPDEPTLARNRAPVSGPPVPPNGQAPWHPQGPDHAGAAPSESSHAPPPRGAAIPLQVGSAVPDQTDEELSLLTPDELPTSPDLRRPHRAAGPSSPTPDQQTAPPGDGPAHPSGPRLGALIEFPRLPRQEVSAQPNGASAEPAPAQPAGQADGARRNPENRRDTENEPTQEWRPPSPRRQASEAPSSAPPVSDGDGDLLIFAQARSAWFRGGTDRVTDWRTEADAGWSAAEAASRPTVGGTTASGLPRRVPSANLVPGAAPNRGRDHSHPVTRDAAQLAAHTAGYFRGWNRARKDTESDFSSVRHQ